MPVYFPLKSEQFPIFLESIGDSWQQMPVHRPNGYPLFHWMQTEKGLGEVWIENDHFYLPPGKGILIAPFVPHKYRSKKNWITAFATFDGSLKKDFRLLVGDENYAVIDESSDFSYLAWIQKWVKSIESDNVDLFALGSDCFQFLLETSRSAEKIKSMDHPLYQQYVLPTINEIRHNYSQPLTNHSLAEKCFITPQYLSRIFQRFTGQSPYQFLLYFRIQRAKELLINETDISVQMIGEQVGFKSESQFISLFKRHTGLTPLKFRNSYY